MPAKKFSQAAAKRMDQAALAAINALHRARDVVGEADNLAMACDGPVSHSREVMTNEQFDRMWAELARALAILRHCRR